MDDSGPPFGHMLLALGGRMSPEIGKSLLPVAVEERCAVRNELSDPVSEEKHKAAEILM